MNKFLLLLILFFSSQPVKSTEIGDIGITTIPTDCVVETPQSFTFTPSVALTKSFQFSFFSTEVPQLSSFTTAPSETPQQKPAHSAELTHIKN